MLEFLFVEARHWLQYGAFLALALYAWFRGELPEKLVGSVFVAAIIFEIVHHSVLPHGGSRDLNAVHAILDASMFAALTPIAMRANRIYPLWILALQLIAVAMHFERGIVEELSPMAYWILIRVPSYLQMFAFTMGLIAHRRRLSREITARPWRNISSR